MRNLNVYCSGVELLIVAKGVPIDVYGVAVLSKLVGNLRFLAIVKGTNQVEEQTR